MFVLTRLAKPAATTSTAGDTGVGAGKVYIPSAFVAVHRATLVLELVAVTAAFGATAPLWSVTSPVMEPEVCASAATANRHHTTTARQIGEPVAQALLPAGSRLVSTLFFASPPSAEMSLGAAD